MPAYIPGTARADVRIMMFVDGENLAKRYGSLLGDAQPKRHVLYEPDIVAWSSIASRTSGPYDYIRRYYYTSAPGDQSARDAIAERLRTAGIDNPRVFHRPKTGRSKRVDITLATDMLTHAHRRNYDIAILAAGDEDYVPLVEAVKAEGRRVALWFVPDGLSPALKASADHYWDMSELLLNDEHTYPGFYAIFG
jgi:NYN domain